MYVKNLRKCSFERLTLWISTVLFIIFGGRLSAQQDTLILTYDAYMSNVLSHHPLAKQADLKTALAKAEWLQAKGSFDPELSANLGAKQFEQKNYFRQAQGRMEIPTRMGLDVVAGYEVADGDYLNPENTTGVSGLWYMGLELNILQGLFVNERNTMLKKASVYQDLALNEQRTLLNELVYSASVSYLIWQQYQHVESVLDENVQLASDYLQNAVVSFENGEKTAVDTLEAYILLQDAITLRQKNQMASVKAKQGLENFLWLDGQPVLLKEGILAENIENELLPEIGIPDYAALLNANPSLLSTSNKLDMLELDQRLKQEKIKPKLKLKYNPLLAANSENMLAGFNTSNYKLGLDFSVPLFLRTERAGIQKGNIKIKETLLDLEYKRLTVENKMQTSWEQQLLGKEQLNLIQQNVIGYGRLLEAEQEKFNFGESSVFLLNKRQEKYINGQLKLVKAHTDYYLQQLEFLYYSNQLIR